MEEKDSQSQNHHHAHAHHHHHHHHPTIQDLIAQTVYEVNQNIYVVYPLFKQYAKHAGPEVHSLFLQRLQDVFAQTAFGDDPSSPRSFRCHIDIKGFSITAAQRYYQLFLRASQEMYTKYPSMSHHMTELYFYNTPTCIQGILQILKPLMDRETVQKIKYV